MEDPPLWARPAEVCGWPTREIVGGNLGYKVRLPEDWKDEPQRQTNDWGDEEVFRGAAEIECFTVEMLRARVTAPPGQWVDAVIAVSGFPIPALVGDREGVPRLLEWEDLGLSLALADRFEADEVSLHKGLARFPRASSGLARLYILSVRRHEVVWKCSLSLATACLPGMPEEVVAANDHVRAGATFGYLRLLSDRWRFDS